MNENSLNLRTDGAVRLPGLIESDLEEWERSTRPFFDLGKPGHRISGSPQIAELAARISKGTPFTAQVGSSWKCARAIAFNKTQDSNWSLAWHQDRTIVVAQRETVPGFEVWSTKEGLTHVEPPFALLEGMVTLRVHLDPVKADNAPLLVARGSHRLGKVSEESIDRAVSQSSVLECHAQAGDGWLYATPVLHASARSTRAQERRVIHLDFARDPLPKPLEWAGIG
ncbi:MAG: phytanoyl-CoA dioxygenase family protein [Pseudomonadota bacterium]